MKVRKAVRASLLALGLVAAWAVVRDNLPSLEGRTTSMALLDTDTTRLGKAIAARAAAHPGLAGIYPLFDGRDAFAARVLLARAAERSLDVQYYIWRPDMSGTLLFDALRQAAERGVRVRLLLDDHNTVGLDPTLAALDAHPNIEVRLFNPVTVRSPRLIGYLTDFRRLNRRMHNKSFTADNQATIIGGRNVGNEYFDATEGTVFVDLDVLAVGPVVKDVSADFDRYWASASSYPVDRLLPAADDAALAAAAARVEHDPAAAAYVKAVRESQFVQKMVEGRLPFEWARTRLVSDDPAKALGRGREKTSLPYQIREIIGQPTRDVELVSAYFVPTAAGVRAFSDLAQRGIEIRILTNSLEATDVAAVHAGYAKRRKPLLEAGVILHEMQRLSPTSQQPPRTGRPFGRSSSASSLHAKTFAVDGNRVFIGSFNFDPRSAHLNTELGFVIESPALAQRIAAAFQDGIRALSYEVRLSETGGLYWIERRNGVEVRHDTEPGTSFWKRLSVRLISLLPVEWLL